MSKNMVSKIKVLFEDADCVVVNKPAGLMVHPDGRDKGPFLTDWIIKTYPETVEVGEPGNDLKGNPINRAGIVHRLDRETSGAIIISKTKRGYESLKKQFADRSVHKKYNAFVWGHMEDDFGTIDRPIGRSSNDFRKWSAQRGARGEMRDAETYWSKIAEGTWNGEENLVALGLGDKFSMLEIEPKTGRTHQIRVHLNAINHPVVGDKLYAPKRPMAFGFERLALHSRYIEFKTTDGQIVKIEAPLPEDFAEAVKLLNAKE